MGVCWFFIYFFVFRFFILRFRLKTPGREDDDEVADAGTGAAGAPGFVGTAAAFITALGGKENIVELDNCATRLRMEVADVSKIDEPALKRAGAAGTIKPGGKSVQVIYGLNVQFVKDAMEGIMSGQVEVPTDAETLAPAAAAGATTTVTAAPPATRIVLRQPVAGTVVPLADVPDPMFAQGIMGPGIAIEPSGDTVVAPADATVSTVFPTGHAVGLVLGDGTELLIHVGIDTVSMNGDGFVPLAKAGDVVTAGTPLLRFDADRIRAAGHPAITPVIVLNNEAATIELT